MSKNLLLIVLVLISLGVHGQTLFDDFYTVPVAGGLNEPSCMTFIEDDYILVGEKSGKIKLVNEKTQLVKTFLTLDTSTDGERGIQNIFYHKASSYLYAYYTRRDGTRNRLSRIKVVQGKAKDEEVIQEFDLMKTDAIYHNGGGLAIHSNHLYVGIGEQYDGPSAYDFERYNGKIIRLNLDGTVPSDNPRKEGSKIQRSIWNYGFRNPFNMDIDSVTGRFLVTDVGYGTWEEINDATLPLFHFGWPFGEGNIAHYNPNIPFKDPAYKYPNQASVNDTTAIDNKGCSITSGVFFRSEKSNYPAGYQGKFFFSDMCSGWIKIFDPDSNESRLFAWNMPPGTLGIKVSSKGELYYLNYNQGTINKVVYDTINAPHFQKKVNDIFTSIGDTVRMQIFIAGAEGIKVTWSKNNKVFFKSESTLLDLKRIVASHAGTYKVKIQNEHGVDSSMFKVIIKRLQQSSNVMSVQTLLRKNTCSTCHSVDKKLIGPPFEEIAKRNYSVKKIVEMIYSPQPQNWPDYPAMAALPNVPKLDAMKIAQWINSLKK